MPSWSSSAKSPTGGENHALMSPVPESKVLVTAVVVFYLIAAISMVVANKWVLNSTEVPLFFLFAQVTVAVVLFLVSDMLGLLPDRLSFDIDVCRKLVPLVALSVVGIISGNYTLKYVDTSFYQVARGLVLPFTVASSYFLLRAPPSIRILIACSIVTLGFFVGIFLDGMPLSVVGIWFGIVNSAITALHSVMTKKSLNIVKNSVLALSWYTNLMIAIALAPISLLAGELPAVMRLLGGRNIASQAVGSISPLHTFLWGSAITGVLGFSMNISSLLSIKVTSPITHMVSSAVRGVVTSLLGVWLFHEIVSSGRISSISIILGGSIFYTWVKHVESLPNGHSFNNMNVLRRWSTFRHERKYSIEEAHTSLIPYLGSIKLNGIATVSKATSNS